MKTTTEMTNDELFDEAVSLMGTRSPRYTELRKEQARRAGPETADPNELVGQVESPRAFTKRMLAKVAK